MATVREKFIRVMRHGDVSAGLPIVEFAPFWNLTVQNWESQGFPQGLSHEEQLEYFGLEYRPWLWKSALSFKALELANLPKDWRVELSIIRSEKDYERILPGLYPRDLSEAEEAQFEADAGRQAKGDTWLSVMMDGPFWFPRMLLGVEPHLYAFLENGGFMKRMIDDLTEYNIHAIAKICEIFTPDLVVFAEDLAYRQGSMISREIFEEFLTPHYRRVVPALNERGIPAMVDSDGFIEPMIPWFLSAGIEGISPLERQAGVDVGRIRRAYPKFLMYGGFDKMVMDKGEEAIRGEFERIKPAVLGGYYIPMADHQVPPAVSLEDYKLYIRLLREFSDEVARESRGPRRSIPADC